MNNSKIKVFNINNSKVMLIDNPNKNFYVHSYIKSGFIDETENNLGISHLIEHVVLESWNQCKNDSCMEFLSKKGINMNGTTDLRLIHYYVYGLIEDLNTMLNYIIDVTVNPKFPDKIINKEKEAVTNELLNYLNDKSSKLHNIFNQNFFNIFGLQNFDNHELQIKNLKNLQSSDLINYYKKQLSSNIYFIIAGKFNKKLESYILNLLYNRLPKINNTFSKNINCFSYKNEIIYINDPTYTMTEILMGIPCDIYPVKMNRILIDFTLNLLNNILLNYLRIKKELIYGISIKYKFSNSGTSIFILVNTKNENATEVYKKIINIINYYKKNNVENDILNGIKKKYIVKSNNLNINTLINFYSKQLISNLEHYSYNNFVNLINKMNVNIVKIIINKLFNFNKLLTVYMSNKKMVN